MIVPANIPGVSKKWNALSSEKNDTKIFWFDSVVLILYNHFLKHSHLRIWLNLRELYMYGEYGCP